MSWEMVKLGEVGNILTGNTPSKKNEQYYNGGEISFIKPNNFNSSTISILSESDEYLTQLGSEKARIVPKNSVLVTCIGTIGKVGISCKDLCFNQQINAIKPTTDKCNSRFLAYSIIYRKIALQAIANAPVVPIINKTQFSSFKIPFPPLETQKRIVELLDRAQALIDKRKEQISLMDQLIQSLFYDMFGDPVSNHMEWDTLPTVKHCSCIVPGRDKPKSFSGTIPWVTTDDLNHLGHTSISKKGLGLTESEIRQVRAKIIPKHSVIMTCVGDLGVVTINDCELVVNQQLHTFQCHEDIINPTFLMYNLAKQTPYMYKMASNTTVPYMNKKIANNTPTIVPPIDIQTTFADRVQKIENKKSVMKNSLQLLEDNFNSLMQRAFKGEMGNNVEIEPVGIGISA